jgi:hypothetical protein
MANPINGGMQADFSATDLWAGGHYELAMSFGARSGALGVKALARLWTHPLLEGCYLRKDQPFSTQSRVSTEGHLEGTLYGIARLENGAILPCASLFISLGNDGDWLQLYLPLGALGRVFAVGGYPFEQSTTYPEWRQKIDLWLGQVAKYVFEQVQFEIAVLGFEVEFSKISVNQISASGIPVPRQDGFLLPTGKGIQWHPPTS